VKQQGEHDQGGEKLPQQPLNSARLSPATDNVGRVDGAPAAALPGGYLAPVRG